MKRAIDETPKLHIHFSVLGLSVVLLTLTLISAYLSSGLYARYTSAAQGSGSARVAKFDVRITEQNDSFEIRIIVLLHIALTLRTDQKYPWNMMLS